VEYLFYDNSNEKRITFHRTSIITDLSIYIFCHMVSILRDGTAELVSFIVFGNLDTSF